jgi:hypothetical protein
MERPTPFRRNKRNHMERKNHTILLPFAGLLAAGMGCGALAQPFGADTPLLRRLRMDATYVREAKDQAWRLRIVGAVPTSPGLYVVVYNEAGGIVRHGQVPSATYTPAAPFLLDVPADGAAQQYVIKLLGPNANCHGVTLPMTDLPFEVYEGTFVMPYPTGKEIRRLAFKVTPDVKEVTFTGGSMRILDSRGNVVAADSGPRSAAPTVNPKHRNDVPSPAELAIAKTKKTGALNQVVLTPQPGQTYWLDPGNANQFQTPKGSPTVYLTFEPERWFSPTVTWDLDTRPWWKGILRP